MIRLLTAIQLALLAVACNALSSAKTKWDVLRFVKQSSKFVSAPKLPFTSNPQPIQVMPGDMLWVPEEDQEKGINSIGLKWSCLDDVVMGGASASSFCNRSGKWAGLVSESNNGGFIGIRTQPFNQNQALDMSKCEGVQFKVKVSSSMNKKSTFKTVVRDSTDFNGICWTGLLKTQSNNPTFASLLGSNKDEISVKIPFESMIPAIFAKVIPDVILDRSNIVAFQLVYSKFLFDGELNASFEAGDFSVTLLELQAY